MSARSIEVYESEYDLDQLSKSNYCFQIAKSVASAPGKKPQYNMIWQSAGLQPDALIQWDVVYGLNWTKKLPLAGKTVTIGGKWHACDKGQILDIGSNGFFTESESDPVDGCIAIGNNNFHPEGGDGIYIVIGIKDADTGKFDAIFFDKAMLYTGGSGSWSPVEEVAWWYEAGMQQGMVIENIKTGAATVDLTMPNPKTQQYYYSTTFLTSVSKWLTTADVPPPIVYAPHPAAITDTNGDTKSSTNIQSGDLIIFPVLGLIALGLGVKKTMHGTISIGLKADFEKKYKYAHIKFKTDMEIMFEIGAPKDALLHSPEALAINDVDIKKDIEQALRCEQREFPAGETFDIGFGNPGAHH